MFVRKAILQIGGELNTCLDKGFASVDSETWQLEAQLLHAMLKHSNAAVFHYTAWQGTHMYCQRGSQGLSGCHDPLSKLLGIPARWH